jgi:hypothetical protein
LAQITIYGGETNQPQKIKVFHGSGPPSFVEGATDGDFYLDVDTGNLYELEWINHGME